MKEIVKRIMDGDPQLPNVTYPPAQISGVEMTALTVRPPRTGVHHRLTLITPDAAQFYFDSLF